MTDYFLVLADKLGVIDMAVPFIAPIEDSLRRVFFINRERDAIQIAFFFKTGCRKRRALRRDRGLVKVEAGNINRAQGEVACRHLENRDRRGGSKPCFKPSRIAGTRSSRFRSGITAFQVNRAPVGIGRRSEIINRLRPEINMAVPGHNDIDAVFVEQFQPARFGVVAVRRHPDSGMHVNGDVLRVVGAHYFLEPIHLLLTAGDVNGFRLAVNDNIQDVVILEVIRRPENVRRAVGGIVGKGVHKRVGIHVGADGVIVFMVARSKRVRHFLKTGLVKQPIPIIHIPAAVNDIARYDAEADIGIHLQSLVNEVVESAGGAIAEELGVGEKQETKRFDIPPGPEIRGLAESGFTNAVFILGVGIKIFQRYRASVALGKPDCTENLASFVDFLRQRERLALAVYPDGVVPALLVGGSVLDKRPFDVRMPTNVHFR